MRTQVNFIRELLVQAYEGSKYHSFKTAVQNLTEEEALWIPPTGYKGYSWADGSILKIIFHTGADKLVQVSTAFGEGSVDWVAMEHRFKAMGGNLQAALQIAQEGYETTLDVLAPLTDDDLLVERPTWGMGRMETGKLLLMLAEHDYYHAGQIIYIRGMYAAAHRK
ncbi:DinB superfamily protein [Armatimonadetes bacterium DC]|nr:DinB superfamily protein [Armatimonadetes bacterium DC]